MFLSRLAVWHPEEVLTNHDLARMVDTSDEWIVDHVGIRERRRAPGDMPVHILGGRAAAGTLDGIDPAGIDLVICALSISDYQIPATANLIAAETGCTGAAAYDVRAACSSFAFALHTIRGLLALRAHQRVLLVIPEAYTHATDYADRSSCILWGDAAFTCLVTLDRPAEPSLEVTDTFIGSRSQDALAVQIPVNGTFRQQGALVHGFAIRKMADVIGQVLARNDLDTPDVAYVVGHQANLRILNKACQRAGLAPEKNLTNIEQFGNCGAAGAPAVLCQNMERFRDSDLIVLSTVGAGLSWGGALLRYAAAVQAPQINEPQPIPVLQGVLQA